MKQKLIFLTVLFAASLAFSTEYFVDASRPDDSGSATNWATAKQTIQAAVDLTVNGDTVWVTNGVYDVGGRITPGYSLTNRVCITNAITVQSVSGPEVTIIKGASGTNEGRDVDSIRCVFMTNGCSLIGFTLTNGYTMASGDAVFDQSGGGVWLSMGCVVSNSVITGCSGRGAYLFYGGEIKNSKLSANKVQGGACLDHGGTISWSEITGNQSDGDGGGVFLSSGGVLNNCIVSSNTASRPSYLSAYGGGIFLSYGGVVNGCLITRNTAKTRGGGAYFRSSGTLNNCTVVQNQGEGVNFETGYGGSGQIINNSVVWDNAIVGGANGTIRATCASGGVTHGSNGCITNKPLFLDAENGDYRLQWGSPCMDAGWMAYAPAGTDLIGNPRITGDTVDMGAYEKPAYIITTTAGANGSITPANPSVIEGHDRTFLIQPVTGYEVSSLIVDGETVPLSESYTFTNVQSVHTLEATFELGHYNLTAENGSGDGVYTNGTIISISADDPPEGHIFYGWTISPTEYINRLLSASSLSTTFTMPPSDVQLIANYTTFPVVNNDRGATNITSSTATLCGMVADSGGENPSVKIYWGAEDGGANSNNWAHVSTLGVQGSNFVSGISGLSPNARYYYRCYAENTMGGAWADSSATFVTLADIPRVSNDGFIENRLNTSVSNASVVIMGEGVAVVRSSGGETYIFEPTVGDPAVWEEVQRLTAPDAETFGGAAFATRDVVVLGNSGDSNGGTEVGAAYVFERDAGGINSWGMVKKLKASDPYQYAWFGSSVAVTDDVVIIGAPGKYENGAYFVGAVYFFEKNAGGPDAWGQVKKLTGNGSSQGSQFGTSLALDGDRLVVGGKGGFGASGTIHIYERNLGGSDAWGLVRNRADPDLYSDSSTFFGESVSISKDTIIVGAGWTDYPGYDTCGAAYIYEKDVGGSNMWGLAKTLWASTREFHGYFGSRVMISGDLAVASDGATSCVFGRNYGGTNVWGDAEKWDSSSFLTWNSLVGVQTRDTNGVCFVNVIDSDGAANITANSAVLRGRVLCTGGDDPNVVIYWGANDGGTNSANWEYTAVLGAQSGSFSAAISGLVPNAPYYYRCYVTNSAASSWADFTEDFKTLSEDGDSNGLPDWWEQQYFGGATNVDPSAFCSNGVNTILQAYIIGLNPNDPQSTFCPSLISDSILQWTPNVSGRVYSVYFSTNLLNGFQCLETNIPWTTGCYTDSVHSACNEGFYKIEVELDN